MCPANPRENNVVYMEFHHDSTLLKSNTLDNQKCVYIIQHNYAYLKTGGELVFCCVLKRK